MALQVNVGTVQVTNGSTTVRHEWKLLMATTSGFVVNAAVTWASGTGTGTVGGWDSVSKTLLVARTAGPNPAAGNTITQTSPAASASVSSVGVGSPPNWNAKVTLPAVATFERHYQDYSVSTVAADSFVLSTAYVGASGRDSEYGLNTDFTSLGLGIVRPGDVGATAIITRSMIRINALLQRSFATLRLSANLTIPTSDTAISWGIEEEDDGGFVSAVPTTTFVVPSGIKRVLISCNLTLTAALTGGSRVVTASLLKGSTVLAKHSLTEPGLALSLARQVTVTAGDTFSVKVITSGGGAAPLILAGTETNFSIGILEVV